tara:strand:+ start:109 stop:267 length:159 start_codon:yes stop_codon:yes gene_type:complete
MDFLGQAWFWVVVAAASELIALNPKLESNSVIQMAMKALKSAKPKSSDTDLK